MVKNVAKDPGRLQRSRKASEALGDELRACSDVVQGRRLHCRIVHDQQRTSYLWNLVVAMYGRCRGVEEAWWVFDGMPERNIFSWNIMLHAFAHNGHLHQAALVFERMPKRSLVSWNSAMSLLPSCCTKKLFEDMPQRDVVSWTVAISELAQQGDLQQACDLFDRMPSWNVVTCTAMVAAYGRNGELQRAAHIFFHIMQQRNIVSWNVLLSYSSSSWGAEQAKYLFDWMPCWDLVSWNSLLAIYAECSYLEDATSLFRTMPAHNPVTWNTMITAYAQQGRVEEAHLMFEQMERRDCISWSALLKAFSRSGSLSLSLQLHARIPQHSLMLGNMVLQACFNAESPSYCSCQDLEHVFLGLQHRDLFSWTTLVVSYASHSDEHLLARASEAFRRQPWRDVVAWNAMLAGHARLARLEDVKQLFDDMPHRDLLSWTPLVTGYAQRGHMTEAANLFAKFPYHDILSCNIMLIGYIHQGHLEEAQFLFNSMPNRDIVSWNMMIGGYARLGNSSTSVALFSSMDLEGLKPDEISYISVVEACTCLDSLKLGRIIHQCIVEDGLMKQTKVANALLNLYAKFGCWTSASEVFERMEHKNVVTWSTMVAAFAQAGCSSKAFEMFHTMQLEGIDSDSVTLVSVLAACSQAGYLADAVRYFEGIVGGEFGIEPTVEHYICLIDSLGRAGLMVEAEQVLNSMPLKPNASAWQTLLACCRSHEDAKRAQVASQRVLNLEPDTCSTYLLLSQIRSLPSS